MKKFIIDNVVTSGANVLVGILNWVFTYLLLKYSGIESANSFLALMSILLVVTIPGTATAYIVNKLGSKSLEFFSKNFKLSSFIILLYLTVVGAVCVVLGYNFQLIVIIYLLIAITLLGNYFKALLQYSLLFTHYSIISIVEVFFKIVVLVVLLNFTENAAIVALVVQLSIGLVASYLITKRKENQLDMSIPTLFDNSVLYTAVIFTASIVVYTSIDTIIGKISLTSIDFNNYQKLLQISKILIFFCSGINIVLIPTLEKEQDSQTNKYLLYALGAEVVATFFAIISVFIFQSKIFEVFSITGLSIGMIVLFILSAGIYSISQTFSIFSFRGNNWKVLSIVFVLITLLQIILFSRSHDISGFIFSALISSIVNLALYILFQRNYFKTRDQIYDASEVV